MGGGGREKGQRTECILFVGENLKDTTVGIEAALKEGKGKEKRREKKKKKKGSAHEHSRLTYLIQNGKPCLIRRYNKALFEVTHPNTLPICKII